MSNLGGFSVLCWVEPTSSLLANLNAKSKTEMEQKLLEDVCTLWGMRWNMDIRIECIDDKYFAYGSNGRFMVGERTLTKALGDLADHVQFMKGGPNTTSKELANYKLCRDKWNVPVQVSDTIGGWETQTLQGTSIQPKQKRY